MDGRDRKDVRPGFTVDIFLKRDQRTGRLTPEWTRSDFGPPRRPASRCMPYYLRRAFISELLLKTDELTAQRLARHANSSMTGPYDRGGERKAERAVCLVYVPYLPQRRGRGGEVSRQRSGDTQGYRACKLRSGMSIYRHHGC